MVQVAGENYEVRNSKGDSMSKAIGVGTVLHGFCNGFFGRDEYGPKRIEAMGYDWIVCRTEDGRPLFALFEGNWRARMPELLEEWSEEEDWQQQLGAEREAIVCKTIIMDNAAPVRAKMLALLELTKLEDISVDELTRMV